MAMDAEMEPRVFLLEADELITTRRSIFLGEEIFQAADERLLQEAGLAQDSGPFTVTKKEKDPPSGDKHDYMSMGPYWWPDPERPDGIPYVRRDGEVNPESRKSDRQALAGLCTAVGTLATAYFFSDYEIFAERAGLLLRCWFLDEATRMNPHLEYGQAVPGRCEGRGIGIIDTLQFSRLVDAVGLLGASSEWNAEDQEGLEIWFGKYLDWLLESDKGRDEGRQANNHGTWYDVQVASLALFAGREEVARRVLAESVPERVTGQIEPDGRQPFELKRTRSLDYSVMNLIGFFDLADLGRHCGLDLWGFEAENGSSIRTAFYWLVGNALKEDEWEYQQITEFEKGKLIPLLRRGGIRFGDPSCEERLRELEGIELAGDRSQLLYPAPRE
jgi:hypothetical protein